MRFRVPEVPRGEYQMVDVRFNSISYVGAIEPLVSTPWDTTDDSLCPHEILNRLDIGLPWN